MSLLATATMPEQAPELPLHPKDGSAPPEERTALCSEGLALPSEDPVPHQSVTHTLATMVGNTPLIRLDKFLSTSAFTLYAKLEKYNLSGSIKARAAQMMLTRALHDHRIIPGVTTVVESSSGNLGIALAQLCTAYGLRFHCVTDVKATPTNIALMRAYGAQVEVIEHPDPATGEYLPARLARVHEICRTIPNTWWPNQYQNPDNPRAHRATIAEILRDVPDITHLVVAAGSCGTLRGCSEELRRLGRDVTVIAVDSISSRIFGEPLIDGPRYIPGHGAAVRPQLMADGLADYLVLVTDMDCVIGCQELLRTESLLLGGSSGAIATAIVRCARQLGSELAGAHVVALMPDGGNRYLDTVYSPSWVRERLGPLPSPETWAFSLENPQPIDLTPQRLSRRKAQ
ncbi:2,3-diaminopropionate biosynthesis protein SbnA [Devriesea agamarum]|uniref:2,3-diaminopropionate biosynthesis protein SbnA n=1 Tax=Devriesea agamarum TaxID=472569 RepID=UPI0018D45326|nr:2,3-diaminopropionate biosynthesis protein SbnA [Devriesea agamarum]